MTDVELLKKEDIDSNKNDKIDVQEMEDFLWSEENIKKLWEEMDSNISPELLQELKSALKDLCENLLNLDELTNNQEKILIYFLNKFWDKYPELKEKLWWLCEKIIKKQNVNDISLNQYKLLLYYFWHWETENKNEKVYKKIWIFIKKLVDRYQKELKKYSAGKWEKPNWTVAQFLEELQQEQIDKLNKLTEQRIKEIEDEMNPLTQQQKKEEERLNILLEKRENEKKEIEELLQKDWDLSEEEKQKLIYFRDYFYSEWHIIYKNNEINEEISNKLTNELWWKWLLYSFWIIWYDKIANQIDKKLNSWLFNSINNIISKWELPKDKECKWLKSLYEWIKKFWRNNPEEYEKINWMVLNEINNIASKTFVNEDTDNLTRPQIWIFQLWANINYWEDLKIDWKRWEKPFGKWDNQKITNLYIYRKEISSRNSKRYSDILKIPDLDSMLQKLWSKEKEHEVFKDFLIFFFNIRKKWLYFENKIKWNTFENLLQNMITSERYRWISAQSEINRLELIKRYSEDQSLRERCEQTIKWLEQIKWVEDLWEYYDKINRQEKDAINRQHENDIIEQLNNNLNKINKLISNLPKLKQNATFQEQDQYQKEYKKAYENVANNFIPIRRNPTYKPYLKDNILSNQIFVEIYCLRKDNIAQKFWKDINQECLKYKKQLDSFSSTENNETERIVDIYYQVQQLNKLINEWKVREEKHYNERRIEVRDLNPCPTDGIAETMRISTAYQSNPEIRQRVEMSTMHQPIIQESVVAIDLYTWPWYDERHETTTKVSITYKNGSKKILTLKDHKDGEMLVPPNPHWWYAILPENLKQKSNQWKIKLAIINWVACVYEFTDWQPIKLWKYDKNRKKLIYSETITVEQYKKALTIENSRSKIWEAEHWEEYRQIQEELKAIMDKNDDVSALYSEWQNKDLNKIELKQLQEWAIKLYNMTKQFASENIREKLTNLKKSLQKLNQNSNEYENPYEKQIRQYIENIDNILTFATPEQVNKAREFKDFCLNNIDNNETFLARRKEWLPSALAFIAAIGATVIAIWTLWLWTPLAAWWWASVWAAVWIWAISAGSALVIDQCSRILLNQTTWFGSIEVDGIIYETHYTNPTLLEAAIDGKVSRADCIKWYWTQFITSTLLQAALMRWGGQFSQYLWKLIAKAPANSFARKSADLVCKVLCKERLKWDAFTEWLINSVEKQVTKEWFMKKFTHELLEETREEWVENAAESQWAVLWAIATIIHCLKPHPWQALQLAWVWHPKIEQPISMWKGKSKLIAQATYDWTNPDNITILKNYYESIPEYKDKVSIQEWGIIKISATNIKGGEVEINWEKIQTNMDIELEFHPSKAPLAIRNLPTELKNLWSLNINGKTWQVLYWSKVRLRVLWKYLESQWIWSVKLNNDWTAILNIWGNEIRLSKDESYFEWKSHWFNITTDEAISNSKEMDNLISEINEDNRQEKLQNLREKINQEYKRITGAEEDLNLTNEQLLSIIEAHKQDGKLWNLDQSELWNKDKILSETIKDKDVRRFLFEAGFCGMRDPFGVWTEQDIELEDPLNNQIDIPLGNQIDIPNSDKYSLWDDIIIFDKVLWTPVVAKIVKYTYETREYIIEWIDNNWAIHTWLITEDQIDSNENEVRNRLDYDDIYQRWEQVYIEDNWRKIVWTITSCCDSNFLIERTEWGIKRKKICSKSYLDECNWRDVTIANSGGNYDNVWVVTPEDDSDVVMVSSGGNYDNAGYVTNVSDNVDSSDVELYSPEEIRRVANIYGEYINFDVDKYVENYTNIPLYWKKEEYIRAVLSFIKDNMKNTQNVDNFWFFRITANVIDYILSNSNITLENIKNIMQDERINVEDIKYAVKQNNKISNETELKQEIKKYNILLNIENEEDLQKFIIWKKVWSNITWNISQYIRENELSQPEEQVKDRYYWNFDQETWKYTMARDIWTSEYDMQLIQNIINQQDIKPRWLESNSVYDLLKKLHDSDIETFVMYSKYLLWEDVTSLAWEYSVWSGWWHELDPALYRHTAIWEEGPISDRKYRIIWEFSTWEIVRSWEINQLEDWTANLWELERITLWEVSNNNISQIIDLETWKVVYDRNTGYVDQSIKNISTNWTNTEDADIVEDDSDVVMLSSGGNYDNVWVINPEVADIVEDDSDVVMVNPESRWINTERREMSEVQRNSDVVAIWDLHGEYIALKWNMEFAWLAREINWHLEWTGWNKKVVFQWDILADRWTDWFKIIKEIHWLREQARKQWWDISIIAWNHDDFMISYLLWWKVSRFRPWEEASGLDIAMNGSQWLWLTELLDFIWINRTWEFEDFLSLWGKDKNKLILENMRNSPEWRMILEEICNMKLVSQVDDVLYCHTNPTSRMLQYLTRWNIQENINTLNQKYQWFLKKALLWEWNWNISLDEFNNISDIFLNTRNRDIWLNEEYANQLRNSWINMISHGHSGWSNDRWYTNNQIEIWGVKVIDIDYWYGKKRKIEREHSVSVIKKEWWVNYIWDNVAYANLEYPIWSEVYAKLDKWWEQKARIESYNPRTKEYTVIIDWNSDVWIILKAENLRNVMDTEFVIDKWNQIRRYKTELPTEKHSLTHIQETSNKLNELITEADKPKLKQSWFKKEYPDDKCENDVQRFIERAQEREVAHKQIFLELGQRSNAQALFIWPPKKAERIIEKVKNECILDWEGWLEAITDFTRSTILFDNYSEFVRWIEVLKQMQQEWRIAKLRIRDRINRKWCNDMIINIETADWYVSEVQFHIPETLILKDGFIWPQVEKLYKDKFNIEFDNYIFTEKIYDLESDSEYQNKKNKYEKIIETINKKKDKKLKLPEQWKEIHWHDIYDIRRILDKRQKDPDLMWELDSDDVISLNKTLEKISDSLADEARNRYGNRTI